MMTPGLRGCFAALLALVCPASPSAQAPATVDRFAQTGERIATVINQRDSAGLAKLIDIDALGTRVVDGLGLSDGVQQDFLRGFRGSRERMASSSIAQIDSQRGVARLVKSTRTAQGSRQVVRIAFFTADDASDGFEYLEFEVNRLGRIVDWVSHAQGTRASDLMRRLSVTMIDNEGVLGRLFGISRIDDSMHEVIATLGNQMRSGDHAGAYRTLERLPDEFRRTVAWASLRTTMATNMDEATYRASLEYLAEHHGELPELQFLLVDHFHFRNEQHKVVAAVQAFERDVVEDGVTNLLKCVSAQQSADIDAGLGYCRRSIELEPDAEDTWWLLVQIALDGRRAEVLLDTLGRYEQQFDMEFDPDKLLLQEGYGWLEREPAFVAWAEARR